MTLGSARTLAALLGADGPIDDLPDGNGVTFQRSPVRPGDIFFAWQGSSSHAIERADEALAAGAAFVVSDVPHPRGLRVQDPQRALLTMGREARARLCAPVIGITGSAGKTTVKAMTAAALAARSTPGNYNTPPGLAQAMVDAAIADEARVAGSTDPRHAPLVLELGIDHPGEMAQLLDLTRPDHGIVTTIGASHLAALGTVEAVAREKTALLAAVHGERLIGAGARPHVPADLLARCTLVRVERATRPGGSAHGDESMPEGTRSTAPGDEVVALLEDAGLGTTHVRALGHAFTLPWTSPTLIEDAVLALTMAVRLGRPFASALADLRRARLEPGRLQWVPLRAARVIDDSYNANPASAAVALDALREGPRPWVAFLGDMLELGELSRDAHRALGERTRDLDLVVAVGPESRAVLAGNPAALHRPDAAGALDLVHDLPEGATVLVKGSRGMRMERLVEALVARFGPEREPRGDTREGPPDTTRAPGGGARSEAEA